MEEFMSILDNREGLDFSVSNTGLWPYARDAEKTAAPTENFLTNVKLLGEDFAVDFLHSLIGMCDELLEIQGAITEGDNIAMVDEQGDFAWYYSLGYLRLQELGLKHVGRGAPLHQVATELNTQFNNILVMMFEKEIESIEQSNITDIKVVQERVVSTMMHLVVLALGRYKKNMFYGKEFKLDDMATTYIRLWALFLLLVNTLPVEVVPNNLSTVLRANIKKLEVRYPDAQFNSAAVLGKNTQEEQEAVANAVGEEV